MKIEKFFLMFIIFVLLFFLTGCGENNGNTMNNSKDNISANKISTEVTVNNISNTLLDNNSINNSVNEIRIAEHEADNTEEELSSFSTKLGGKDSPRTRNIGITTSILNETIVKDGETFSFCGLIGDPTADRGYEKADAFDSKGKTIQSYGGGNCQVSSTLYNAVLATKDLEVKERHAHIKPVHYVEKDKDATVAYGSVDFKFKNNTGTSIKIYANSDLNSVNIRIVKFII